MTIANPPDIPPKPTADPVPAAARAPIPTICLSWAEEDLENRFGLFKGARYTDVNKLLSLLLALLITGLFFGLLYYLDNALAGPALSRAGPTNALPAGLAGAANAPSPFTGLPTATTASAPQSAAQGSRGWATLFIKPFIRQGNVWTVGPAMLFFFWSMVFLFFKQRKVRFQERALDLAAVPQQPEFTLNESTARTVLERLHSIVDHPRHFILLNRIDRALSNLHNIGGLSDVSTILKAQAENDENVVASSYTLVNGLVWAIPVLGFIGTVQGLSVAIGTFTQTLQSSGDLNAIKANLQGVTGGLATAFETTLVALVAALIIQLLVNFLQQRESSFLDACNDYCHAHVTSKLRLLPAPSPDPARGDRPAETPQAG